MKTLTKEVFCRYYASICDLCNGSRLVRKDGKRIGCPCQRKADARFQFEKIHINPHSLKQKTWGDFNGIIKLNNKIVGHLDPSCVQGAKEKSLKYCFKGGVPSPENRIVHKHIRDGQNIVIGGPRHSGKTLLAILIIKEVRQAILEQHAHATFAWISSSELRNAARWDENKAIDHAYLGELSDVDFLVIDDVDIDKRGGDSPDMTRSYGHHTNPPDRISLNMLFGVRDMHRRPTIIISSEKFLTDLENPIYEDFIIQQWGDEFYALATKSSNVMMRLEKE